MFDSKFKLLKVKDFADRIATLPVAVAKHKAIADAQHENAVDCG